ncbi:MAG: ethanolamine utilization protein EutH, partial [Clostridium sp.]
MENIVLYIITLFFILGAIDYLIGNKFFIGEEFESGIKTMGPLAISMVGILSITPLLSSIIEIVISP